MGHKRPVDLVLVLNAEQLLMCLLCVSVALHRPAKRAKVGWIVRETHYHVVVVFVTTRFPVP